MKFNSGIYTILFFSFTVSYIYSSAQVTSRTDISASNRDSLFKLGLFYDTGNKKLVDTIKGVLKQGKWIEYDSNGNIRSQGNFTSGKKTGVWVDYDTQGNIINKTFYLNDDSLRFEHCNYSILEVPAEPGHIVYFQDYLNTFGMTNGRFLSRYPNGAKKDEAYIKNGYPEGQWKSYDANGKLILLRSYKNGIRNGIFRTYRSDGKLIFETSYINGKYNGLIREYNLNGNLIKKGQFNSGTGLLTTFYDNGKIKSIEHYNNMNQDGEWKKFYENGNLMEISNWRNNQLNGKYIQHSENGVIESMAYYQNGLREGVAFFYNDFSNKPLIKGEFRAGNKHGDWLYFCSQGRGLVLYEKYDNGNLILTEKYQID